MLIKNGKRNKAPVKLSLEVIMLWGDPRLATFAAIIYVGQKSIPFIDGEISTGWNWREAFKRAILKSIGIFT